MRSRSLALVGSGLLVAAVALGAVLVHDGERAAPALAQAEPGDAVLLKGAVQDFYPSRSLTAWDPVLPILAAHNHTYLLGKDGEGAVALLTSDKPAPDTVVLTEGKVLLVLPHPDGSGRLLVVVHVEAWREPFLFR